MQANIRESFKELIQYSKEFNVLYVEDDEGIRSATVGMLESFFKSIDVANDGLEGLNMYKENTNTNGKSKYDIIITDLNMPNMDGMDMSRGIKDIYLDQKIIIVSAYSGAEHFTQTIEIGIDGYILKPVKMPQMLFVLKKVAKQLLIKKENESYKSNLEGLVEEKTIQVEEQAKELLEQAKKDTLTGLPNNVKLEEVLNNIDVEYHTLLLDADYFVNINRTYGMKIGDEVLKLLGKKIQKYIPKNAELFRLESDKFLILLREPKENQMDKVAKTINNYFNQYSVEFDEIDFKITFTIGGSTASNKEAISHCFIAVEEGKHMGRNRYIPYDENSDYSKEQQINIEYMQKIKQIILEDNIVPYCQPMLNNHTGEIDKFEVLARAIDDGEVVAPYKFIKAAENTGLMAVVTKIIIDKSFDIFSSNNFDFSINITEQDLKDGYLVDYLKRSAKVNEIVPSRITLEILENITNTSDPKVMDQIDELSDTGFLIALDDFGCENSNFTRLSELRASIIKIDGQFIKDLDTNIKHLRIVESIVYLAKKLGMKIIAEFVHNETIKDIIKDLGIDYSQGHYFSPPVKFEDLKDVIAQYKK
jgi:diguanylate cyclase (GGDEF)-like protein